MARIGDNYISALLWTRIMLLLMMCITMTCTANVHHKVECSQRITADRPVHISSNNESRPCLYEITVPPNTLPDHSFQVTLLQFSVGHRSENGSSCTGGWARIGSSLYCGNSVPPGTQLLFPTSRTHRQLDIMLEPGPDHLFQARVELLPRLTLQERHPEMILATPGEPVQNSICDRVYTCLEYPGYCQLSLPGFPGAYARPLNCSYHLKAPEPGVIIGGRHELFEVGNTHKITHSCDNDDYVAIYDGGELVSRFCGKSRKFPRIVSKTSDIIVQFVSTKAGLPARGFVLSVERSPPHLTEHARCFETLKVGSAVQQLRSPHHWLAQGSHCSYTLTAKPGKQIWVLVTNVKTKNNCSEYDEHVAIYDGNKRIANFCNQNESSFPVVSKSHQLKLVYYSPNGTLDATSKFYFIIRYAAVNIIESGEHILNTWCDTVFSDKTSGPFSLLNPREIILHNHGKIISKNLTCKYYFHAPESYTVRLQLDHTSFEPLYRCNSVIDSCETGKFDKLLVTELFQKNILGCECGARKHAQIFQSKGSEIIITLTLNLNYDLVNTSLKYSPELYQFQGRYMFIPPSDDSLHCGLYTLNNLSLDFPSKLDLSITTPIMCRWQLKNISSLQLIHLNLSPDCKNNYVILETNITDFKLCNGDHLPEMISQEISINVYLIASRGHPQLKMTWNSAQTNVWSSYDNTDKPQHEEGCYGTLTLSLLMVAAALCTMTIALALALLVYRYRTSLWFPSWRRQQYSSVTRNVNASFW